MSKIYKAINAVQMAISKTGVSKDQKNTQQGFKFRGIDDVMNSLSPLLAEHGVCIFPCVVSRYVTERTTAKGGTLFYVVLEVKYDFVCAEDASREVVTVFGEAMDSGDKATNKALSAAYKYAVLQTFCIPTEGGEDPDSTTHEIIPAKPIQPVKVTNAEVTGIHLELKNAIKEYKIPLSNIDLWKNSYKVASLNDLKESQVKEILEMIKDLSGMFAEKIDKATGEVLS